MVPATKKLDVPNDETVPQTYTTLRHRMGREFDRRRREQRDTCHRAAPPGGFWLDYGPPGIAKGRGDCKSNPFSQVKGKGSTSLCFAAISGNCTESAEGCIASHHTELINGSRSKRGLPPLKPTVAVTNDGQVRGFPTPPGYALHKIGGGKTIPTVGGNTIATSQTCVNKCHVEGRGQRGLVNLANQTRRFVTDFSDWNEGATIGWYRPESWPTPSHSPRRLQCASWIQEKRPQFQNFVAEKKSVIFKPRKSRSEPQRASHAVPRAGR